jgi:regulator of sigma E protease
MLGSWLVWLATNWLALVVVLLAFGFIIFVHELGHFLTAKRAGITVHEFALGFGPKLYSRKVAETEYCLRIFPFGGFVRMEGEDDPDSDPNDPGNFLNKPVMSQIVVLGGGCFMNYLSALLVLLFLGFFHGIPHLDPAPVPSVIGGLVQGDPAEKAGLQPNDLIVKVEGHDVATFEDLVKQISPRGGQPTRITVMRDDKSLEFTLTPKPAEDEKTHEKVGRVGVKPLSPKVTLSWTTATSAGEVFQMAGYWINKITLLPVEIVRRLTHHEMTVAEVKEGTGGPLAIGQMLFELYQQGLWALLFFWAIISVSVGSFNLLPIPALDGARILFVGIGALRGRPLDPRKESMVHFAGLVVLLGVMAIFTLYDVKRMIQGVHFF